MNALTIITTLDGSHSLLNTTLNETYHSTHGAIQESNHVFIKNGFEFLLQQNRVDEINILEIGLGTGLNALLTWQNSIRSDKKIRYTSLEAFPLDITLAQQLNYPKALAMGDADSKFTKLLQAPWDVETEMQANFHLTKRLIKLEEADLGNENFDLVYFDAFAPNKQPEMWEPAILHKVTAAMKGPGVFVTYCAKGQLKRDLKSLGLLVETLPGPPGKKEMVRALKTAL